ncbi:MAG: LysR family transcriptional regulator [Myxococcaceae bacterium]|nr:LysR family transcriptional regulator [Myxococcaceae bacterium]
MSAFVNTGALDLNRLRVLHAVLELRSVTRAAAVLHVTPAAISNALAQLRETFADPLLVRSGRGLVPTPRAAALSPRLAEAMAAMARVADARLPFDPARSTRTFELACSDSEQISEVPAIAAAFARKLPRAQLKLLSVDQLEAGGGLAGGEADAAIAPAGPALGQGFHAEPLYEEEGVLVVRKGHPRAGRKMTRAQFNQLRHIDILVSLGKGGIGHDIVEAFFAEHGLKRDVAISVPSFAAAAAIASQTDWVAGLPRRLAQRFVRQLPLAIVEPPVPPVRFRMQLVWHDRTDADEGARCFRSVVMSAVRGSRSRAAR